MATRNSGNDVKVKSLPDQCIQFLQSLVLPQRFFLILFSAPAVFVAIACYFSWVYISWVYGTVISFAFAVVLYLAIGAYEYPSPANYNRVLWDYKKKSARKIVYQEAVERVKSRGFMGVRDWLIMESPVLSALVSSSTPLPLPSRRSRSRKIRLTIVGCVTAAFVGFASLGSPSTISTHGWIMAQVGFSVIVLPLAVVWYRFWFELPQTQKKGLTLQQVLSFVTGEDKRAMLAVDYEVNGGRFAETLQVARGDDLVSINQANNEATALIGDGYAVNIAGLSVPTYETNRGVALHGATGSGKSQVIEGLMASVLDNMRLGDTTARMVVFDKGNAFLTDLLCQGVPMHVWAPCDHNSIQWDLLADVKSEQDAINFAKGFRELNPRANSNPFFERGVELAIAGCLMGLKASGRQYGVGIHELCTILADEHLLHQLLETTSLGRDALVQLFGHGLSSGDMISSLRQTAALLRASSKPLLKGRSFSLERFFAEDGWEQLLVVSFTERDRSAIAPGLGLFFAALAQRQLGQTPLTHPEQIAGCRQTFVIVDELPGLPALETLPTLLTEGRKFGISVVLGVPSVDLVRQRYGSDTTKAIFSSCGTVFLGGCREESARWSSTYIGERVLLKKVRSSGNSYGPGGSGSHDSIQEQLVTEALIKAAEFASYPSPAKALGVHGVLVHPYGVSRIFLPYGYLKACGIGSKA